jgi:hypothetical protein
MSIRMAAIMAIALGCITTNSSAQTNVTGPKAVVYKTKKNYNNLVPVTLSADKSRIASYPAPSDLKQNGNLAKPTKLKKNYLLDNRGIGKNTVFLNMTYEQYAALSEAPTLNEMYAMIVDKDPIAEMCDCGERSKYKNTEQELNKLIKSKKLKKNCQTIK